MALNHSTVAPNVSRKLILRGVLVIAALIIVANAFFVVPPSNEAGVRWLGGTVMTKQPLGVGLHFKVPFLETVDQLQVTRSTYKLPRMSVYTNDNQSVTIGISVIYQIPSASVLKLLYDVGRSGNVDIDSTILPVVKDRALAAFAKYNTLDISDKREQITASMKRDVADALNTLFGIRVLDVQLTSISYSPTFVHSVESAVRAKAEAVRAQNQVQEKHFQGEQTKVLAEANAAAAVKKASGDAQAAIIEADARAKAIATIGAALRANPQYVKFYGLKHWDGKLPQVVGGRGTLPMIELGGKGGG